MPTTSNCVPFDRARGRSGRGKRVPVEEMTAMFDHLSPAQYAFLTGVLAILAEHGEEALTKSCEMVLERFGHRHAG